MAGDRPKTEMKSVGRKRPCELCGGFDGCSYGADGLIMCRRNKGEIPGYKNYGPAKRETQWTLYRREENPLRTDKNRRHKGHFHRPALNGKSNSAVDWQNRAEELARHLTAERAEELATALGLPVGVFAELQIGYCERGPHPEPGGPCWTFPETDGAGRVIGLVCRYKQGDRTGKNKKSWLGANRGLTIPCNWRCRVGAIYLPEGQSDTLTLTALGLAAIGRPSNKGGIDELVTILREVPADRPIIVTAEWDANEIGGWPGRDGAIETATELQRRLGRPVKWALPPSKLKDVRAWALAQGLKRTGESISDDWHAAGERLVEELADGANPVKPAGAPEINPRGTQNGSSTCLVTRCLADVVPKPLKWLVPDYIPAGKLIMVAGDGGGGKSVLTLDMAACLTTGRPALGLDYRSMPPAEVLLISCEDDLEDTIVPRIIAAGGDRSRLHHVEGIRSPDGKIAPFNLTYFEAMEAKLTERPDIRLVVIDPAGAYIGGVDDHRDSDLRALLAPLADVAGRRNVTIAIVKHLNRTANAKAVHRVSGSSGYVNTVRAAFMIAPDPDDFDRQLFMPLKFNIAKKPRGLS